MFLLTPGSVVSASIALYMYRIAFEMYQIAFGNVTSDTKAQMNFRRGGDPAFHHHASAMYLRINRREAFLGALGFQTCRHRRPECAGSRLNCAKSGWVSIWFLALVHVKYISRKVRTGPLDHAFQTYPRIRPRNVARFGWAPSHQYGSAVYFRMKGPKAFLQAPAS